MRPENEHADRSTPHPILMPGMVVQAKAGHDKYRLYLVTKVAADRVWLTDGLYRPVDKQKKKNTGHVRIVEPNAHLDVQQLQLIGDTGQQNAWIRKSLATYAASGACRRKPVKQSHKAQKTSHTSHGLIKEEV